MGENVRKEERERERARKKKEEASTQTSKKPNKHTNKGRARGRGFNGLVWSAGDCSSRLSAHLAYGCLSVQRLLLEAPLSARRFVSSFLGLGPRFAAPGSALGFP